MRVLLVYSRVGGGHLSAARALATELESGGRAEVKIVDAYVECGRFPVTRFPAAYSRLSGRHPRLWSMVYHRSDTRLAPRWVLAPFLRAGFQRLVAREQPNLVVSVLPAVNGLLAHAAATVGARMEVVLTDWHAVHRLWVARGVNHYTAPTESARDDCLRFGAPPGLVDVVGIPVRREFAAQAKRVGTHTGSGPFTILAMVGSEGSPRALTNVANVAKLEIDAQMLVVCGRNEVLRKHVERLDARMAVKALGFVDDVAGLMSSADLLLTKAGGLTLAEAFCCGVPVVVHDVLPGQEAGNVEYVLGQGGAVYARTPTALCRLVTELHADRARRLALAQRGACLARPDASRQIADNLLKRLMLQDAAAGRE
jgi:UDP-N-acetylglucosamine:LPS N-acetylglucosamine transferase